MYKILFVDDNVMCCEKMSNILVEHGYYVKVAMNGLKGLEFFIKEKFDVVIAGLEKDKISGDDFLGAIRNVSPNIITVMLADFISFDLENKILDSRIDKCLLRDIKKSLFLKNIDVLIAQGKNYQRIDFENPNDNILSSKKEDIEIDLVAYTVKKNEIKISLTPKELNILKLFLNNKNKAFSRNDIYRKLWGREGFPEEFRVIDSHIKAIRKKMNIKTIVSIHGFGYKWEE